MFKIAILTEIINNHSGARAPLELAKRLSTLGNQVTVYGYKNNIDHQTILDLKGNNIKIVTFPNLPRGLLARVMPNLKLTKGLKTGNFDVVIFTGSWPFFVACKLSNIPILRIFMGTQFGAYLENFLPNKQVSLFNNIVNFFGNLYIYVLELMIIHLSTHIVAISKYTAQEVKRLYFRKVDQVIYLGGDHLIRFTNKARNSQINLLSVSRITPYKRFHLLIDAIQKLKSGKQVILTIVGTKVKADYFKYLQKIAKKNIRFIINPTDQKLAKLYAQSDLYLSADKYLFFGFPIAEVSFFSKPSIAYSFGAAKELIISNQTGKIVQSQDELITSIGYYLNHKGQLKVHGQNAQKRAQKLFSWSEIAKKYQLFLTQRLK